MQVAALKPTSGFKNSNSAKGLCGLLCHIRAETSETVVDLPGVLKVSRTLRDFLSVFVDLRKEKHILFGKICHYHNSWPLTIFKHVLGGVSR